MTTRVPNLGKEWEPFFVRQVKSKKPLKPVMVNQKGKGIGSIKRSEVFYDSSQLGHGEVKVVKPLLVSDVAVGVDQAEAKMKKGGLKGVRRGGGVTKKGRKRTRKSSKRKTTGRARSRASKKTTRRKPRSKKRKSKKRNIFAK